MSKTNMEKLAEFGQSIWLDNINRSMLEDGSLENLIEAGLRGMTSNPSIFDKAISQSNDYDEKIERLCGAGKNTFEIYDDLTVEDVQDAADLFKSVYEKTNGLDGWVSLEVDPRLAFDIEKTIEEARRLYKKVNRPNVMFKIPATKEGCKAAEELLAGGMNINFTLIFSVAQYINTTAAYLRGIKKFARNGGDLKNVRSVASVFVSRIDSAVDKEIDKLLEKGSEAALKGRAAVANSKLMYQKFAEIFSSKEILELKKEGANLQRPLWASTSTKNPSYNDIKYVTELIAKDTVNTLPDNTLEAFLDHGVIKNAINIEDKEPQNIMEELVNFEIDINDVCAKLLADGVAAFEKSFASLLKSIEEKAKTLYGR